jgi:hypothetical protein
LTIQEVTDMREKRNVIGLFILITLIPISFVPATPRGKPAEEDLQALVDSWVGMWNSYDLTMVDELFLQDSRVSYFSSEKEGLIQGIEDIRKHHAGFGFVDGGKSQANKLWVENVHIQNFGSAAVVAGIWYFQRASEDVESVQKGPFTFVCVRQGDKWRLAHLNFSEYKNRD